MKETTQRFWCSPTTMEPTQLSLKIGYLQTQWFVCFFFWNLLLLLGVHLISFHMFPLKNDYNWGYTRFPDTPTMGIHRGARKKNPGM